VVGTCRLRFAPGECKLERMAVDKRYRNGKIGMRLIESAEAEARLRDAAEILLHGQLRARGFYERAGYVALSEEVLVEEGIEHVRMRKVLAAS
jgi:predicted GNAT family N-acyltransferase